MGIFSRLFQRGQDGQQVSSDAEKAAANEADDDVVPASPDEPVGSSPPVLAAAVAGGGAAGALAAPIWGWPQRHSEPRDPTPIPASEAAPPAPVVESAAASSPPDPRDAKDAGAAKGSRDAKDEKRDAKDEKKLAAPVTAPVTPPSGSNSPSSGTAAAPAPTPPPGSSAPKGRASNPSMPLPSVASPAAPQPPSAAPTSSSNAAPATSGLVAPGKKRDDATMVMSPPPPGKSAQVAPKAKKAQNQTTTIAVAPPPAKTSAPASAPSSASSASGATAAPPPPTTANAAASSAAAAPPPGPAKRPSTPSAPIVTFSAAPSASPARRSPATLPPEMAATAAAALDALSALDEPSEDGGAAAEMAAEMAAPPAAASAPAPLEPASSRRDTSVDDAAAPNAEIFGELSEASAVDAAFLAMADESSSFAGAASPSGEGSAASSTVMLPISDEISESFNRAFFDLTEGNGGNAGISTASDLAAVRDVFNDIAVVHVSQVRDVMLELRFGDADPAWLESTKPALRSLRAMAEQMELLELCGALDVFCEAVDAAVSNRARIGEEAKAELLARYGKLSDLIPQAFELDAERDRREPIIVEALLYQIDGVEKPVIDRLFAVGLNRLDALMRANVDDLVMMSEVRREVAEAIVEQFRTYRATADAAVSTRDPAAERRSLGDLVIMLSILQDDFLRAADDWTEDARLRKRALRKEREQTFQRIRVSLVRLGDRDQLSKLERLPFNERIAALERYVANQPPGRP